MRCVRCSHIRLLLHFEFDLSSNLHDLPLQLTQFRWFVALLHNEMCGRISIANSISSVSDRIGLGTSNSCSFTVFSWAWAVRFCSTVNLNLFLVLVLCLHPSFVLRDWGNVVSVMVPRAMPKNTKHAKLHVVLFLWIFRRFYCMNFMLSNSIDSVCMQNVDNGFYFQRIKNWKKMHFISSSEERSFTLLQHE